MATPSSVPAWKIPWTEESGELQSMGLHRVGHNSACTHILVSRPHPINTKNFPITPENSFAITQFGSYQYIATLVSSVPLTPGHRRMTLKKIQISSYFICKCFLVFL